MPENLARVVQSCWMQNPEERPDAMNVESCTQTKLVISTYDAADNGLVYIQGQGDACKRVTSSGIAFYEFDFEECGIKWEMLFRIVVQKSRGYQTGADKVIPIFCVADTSDLLVSNSNKADKQDDSSVNMTVKPSAAMKFYKVVSDEEVSGTEVKLSDVLIMTLQLGDEWTGDFDIKARYCIASKIVIIDEFCATDTDLFPNFSRFKRGYLMSEFGAFRSTNLEGGAIEMNFTCVLQVCKGDCEESNCMGYAGWGRKKRYVTPVNVIGEINASNKVPSKKESVGSIGHNIAKRQTEDFDIDVGARVKIVEKYSEIQIITEETMCMNGAVLITTIVFLSTGSTPARDKQDDSSVNMTVKPSAAMKFYKVVSDEEVSGTEVKLSDVLIMTFQLGDEWTGAY
ncbi:uncharacterized protein LOC127839959 [Dreissena polymorpha]|uniref:uncharacterized protein LOC127839959 n=1 Tax=Dreissena polymorpha TaxID=45954 RepID=UPI002264D855|nr:uncharacterized protein LOC127839959 [Dreissena polymorpha]